MGAAAISNPAKYFVYQLAMLCYAMPNISDSVLGCAGSSELRNLDIFCFFQHSTVFI